MKQYIGTKLIEAEKAYRVDGKVVTLAENRVPCGSEVERGYKVRYADGYESFSPAEVFERAYLPLEVNGELKTEAPSISAEMVERFIDHHETVTMGGKTTVVRAVLRNGFEIVESSSCVSAENYDEKLGEEICMERIRNKIWELLGFLLQTAVGGVNGEAAAENCCCDEECERSCCDKESAADYAEAADGTLVYLAADARQERRGDRARARGFDRNCEGRVRRARRGRGHRQLFQGRARCSGRCKSAALLSEQITRAAGDGGCGDLCQRLAGGARLPHRARVRGRVRRCKDRASRGGLSGAEDQH